MDNSGTAMATTELYDPTAGTWIWSTSTATGNLNTARHNHRAALLSDGAVLVLGGQDVGGTALATGEIVSPSRNLGTLSRPTLTTARYNHTTTLLRNGTVLVIGGQDVAGNPLGTTQI